MNVINFKDYKKPTIKISIVDFFLQKKFCQLTDKEIGWRGYAKKIDEDIYQVYNLFVPKHSVANGAFYETVIEADKTEIDKLIKNGNESEIQHMKFYGHSHVSMTTRPSGFDVNQYVKAANENCDFIIAAVFNCKNEHSVHLYDYESGISFCDLEFTLYNSSIKDMIGFLIDYLQYFEKNIKNPMDVDVSSLFEDIGTFLLKDCLDEEELINMAKVMVLNSAPDLHELSKAFNVIAKPSKHNYNIDHYSPKFIDPEEPLLLDESDWV